MTLIKPTPRLSFVSMGRLSSSFI